MLNFCPLCVAEVYTLRCDAMQAGLRTTHYIVHPRLTDYAAKICSFSLFAKPVLIYFTIYRFLACRATAESRDIPQHRIDIANICKKLTFFLDKIDSRFAADSAVFIRPYA